MDSNFSQHTKNQLTRLAEVRELYRQKQEKLKQLIECYEQEKRKQLIERYEQEKRKQLIERYEQENEFPDRQIEELEAQDFNIKTEESPIEVTEEQISDHEKEKNDFIEQTRKMDFRVPK